MTPDKLVRDPVYKQLNDALRRLITSGEFTRGAKFLSEREIGERFSVSRATANKALSTLVAEGVLAFKKGVGTFVRGSGRVAEWRPFSIFAGQETSTRVLVAERIAGTALDPDVRAELGLAEGEAAFYVERLRLLNEEPLVLEQRYVVERSCPGLLEHDLGASLRVLWSERYGLEIGTVVQSVRAVCAGTSEAELLDIETGGACLGVTTLGQLASGTALWWERALCRGDACELHAPALECSLLARRTSRPTRLRTG